MKLKTLSILLLLSSFYVHAEVLSAAVVANQDEDDKKEKIDSATVISSRAGDKTPVNYSTLSSKELRNNSPAASLPQTLALQSSVVSYSESGNGLGNTAMTVRGVKGSQINVSLNGITLNDAESQEVFWMNIPALPSLLSSVQLQRGLGCSSAGAGAFGASINMNSASVSSAPSFRAEVSAGSWNTFTRSLSATSGLRRGGVYANIAWTKGNTDAYVRGAGVRAQSLFAVAGLLREKYSLRLSYLLGDQRSGIAWDGISLEQYYKDRRFNASEGDYDDYRQQHLQLNYTRVLSPKLFLSNTLNYTRGDGYDKYGEIRKSMGNNYFVLKTDLKYNSENSRLSGGVYLSRYAGRHFGADYLNKSRKDDHSFYLRGEFDLSSSWTLYSDLQFRSLNHSIRGLDDDYLSLDYSAESNFFNPRVGLSWNKGGHKSYASLAYGHKEPGRGDIIANTKGGWQPIKPEKMLDFEFGYEYKSEKFGAEAGVYLMEYKDILLETGRLNSSGYAIKENVPRGWRRGLEFSLWRQCFRWLRMSGNLQLSLNQLKDYTSFVSVSDGLPGESVEINYGKSPMLLSPSVVSMLRAEIQAGRIALFALDGKYIGKQYIDNSGRKEMEVPEYFVVNLSASKEFKLGSGVLGISAYLNNALSHRYWAYGWRYEYYNKESGTLEYGIGVYPQPLANFTIKTTLQF